MANTSTAAPRQYTPPKLVKRDKLSAVTAMPAGSAKKG